MHVAVVLNIYYHDFNHISCSQPVHLFVHHISPSLFLLRIALAGRENG